MTTAVPSKVHRALAIEIDAAAMRLLVLRHAKSEKAEAGMPDRVRRLNARGLRDAGFMGCDDVLAPQQRQEHDRGEREDEQVLCRGIAQRDRE